MRYYLPGIGRFISRVRLREAVAMERATYRDLFEQWGITIAQLGTLEPLPPNDMPEHAYPELHQIWRTSIGPLGTGAAFSRDRVVSEHPYSYSECNPLSMVDPTGLKCQPLTYECTPPVICPWVLRPFAGVIFGHYQRYCATDDCPFFCEAYAQARGAAFDDCMKACKTLLKGGGSVKSTATCDCKPIKCKCSTTKAPKWALMRTCRCENMPPQP